MLVPKGPTLCYSSIASVLQPATLYCNVLLTGLPYSVLFQHYSKTTNCYALLHSTSSSTPVLYSLPKSNTQYNTSLQLHRSHEKSWKSCLLLPLVASPVDGSIPQLLAGRGPFSDRAGDIPGCVCVTCSSQALFSVGRMLSYHGSTALPGSSLVRDKTRCRNLTAMLLASSFLATQFAFTLTFFLEQNGACLSSICCTCGVYGFFFSL